MFPLPYFFFIVPYQCGVLKRAIKIASCCARTAAAGNNFLFWQLKIKFFFFLFCLSWRVFESESVATTLPLAVQLDWGCLVRRGAYKSNPTCAFCRCAHPSRHLLSEIRVRSAGCVRTEKIILQMYLEKKKIKQPSKYGCFLFSWI